MTTPTNTEQVHGTSIYPSFTELRIYPSFTEVREQFQAPQSFKINFQREVYNQIVNGSLRVEGIEVQSQNSATKVNNLENQTVFVRRPREQPIQCLVIRPQDLLVKDIKSGRYFRAQPNELEYIHIPEEDCEEITFALKEAGDATLSYLIHGIIWSPRYNLNLHSDGHIFEAWADMTNQTKRDYQIKHTELFGGDVKLQQSTPVVRPMAAQYYAPPPPPCFAPPPPRAPYIESQGELAGMYWYSIDQPFVLIQQSTFSLPFVQPTIKLEKYVGLQMYFHERTQKGKFHRKYRLQSDKFLPKGTITIREDGRVVGQAALRDLVQDEKQDLDCGEDPDVSFTREVQILSQKRESASYRIRLSIQNTKTKSIPYEYKEIISSAKFIITSVTDDNHPESNEKIQPTSEGLQIVGHALEANSEQVFQYEVLLEYTNNHPQYYPLPPPPPPVY